MTGQTYPESVLCLSRKAIPDNWLAMETAIRMDEESFFGCINKCQARYIPRTQAEIDPSLKQLIPYIVLQSSDNRLIASYQRCGSETRLHAYRSIGIGGHVNKDDRTNNGASLKSTVEAGIRRELTEELLDLPSQTRPVFTGVINEEITEVGAVHIGIVYRLMIPETSRIKASEELYDFQWSKPDQLKDRPLEIWSKLAFKLLAETACDDNLLS